MEVLHYLNPLNHFSEGQYRSFWQVLFATILQGLWARLFACVFLILAFWFGVRKQRFQMGLAFFILTLTIAYGAAILKIAGLM